MQAVQMPFGKSPSAAMRRANSSTAPAKMRQSCVIAHNWRTTMRQNASILVACGLTLVLAGFALHDQAPAQPVTVAFAAR